MKRVAFWLLEVVVETIIGAIAMETGTRLGEELGKRLVKKTKPTKRVGRPPKPPRKKRRKAA